MPRLPFDPTTPEGLARAKWMREKARCEDDFAYLARTYLRLKAKDVIGMPTLTFRPVQAYLHERAEAMKRRTGWVRLIVGKCRQVGSTTYTRARHFHQTAFKSNRNALLLAHDEPSGQKLLADHDKVYLTHLPPQLTPRVGRDAKDGLIFSGRSSQIMVGHALNPNVGASTMQHLVHITEAARFGRHAETMQSSLFPAISAAKGDDCSEVIIESTAVFGGDWFKTFAEDAIAGRNEYEFVFVPAYMHPDYTRPIPRGFRPSAYEQELKRRHGCSDAFIVWYRERQAEYRHNPALIRQEYPLDFAEAWQLPKGALRVFKDDILVPLRDGLRPGERMVPRSQGLEPAFSGPVEVWQRPEPGVYYDMGVDVALGRTADADWTVACVIRRDTLEQVAQLRIQMDPTKPEFLDLIYWLGWAYNTAQVIIDTTGGYGHIVLSELHRRSYPAIWRWRNRRDAKERVSTKEGFDFTADDDRDILVMEAVTAVARGTVVIHSEVLYDEMEAYLNVGLHEYKPALKTLHDDAIVAYMMALLAARDERQEWAPTTEALPAVTPPEPWRRHDIEHDLHPDDSPHLVAVQPWGA